MTNVRQEFRVVLKISKINETFLKIESEDRGALHELSNFFTFEVPGAKFMPSVKRRQWDGKIRLLNSRNNTMYVGLLPYIRTFCDERDYDLQYDSDLELQEEFSFQEAVEFSQTLGLPFEARKYQLEAFTHSVRHNRAMILSPTGSGKSLIIYLLTRFYSEKTLIIVPTVSLVRQLYSDFKDYGYKGECKLISAGVDKEVIDEDITITTWQSIYQMPKKWFDQFDVVVGDEAHLFKAKSLTSIMTKLSGCKYRFGFTGTLDGSETHKLVLEGMFGQVQSFVKTKQLIEGDTLADLKIKILVLKYSEATRKAQKEAKYHDEMDFVTQNSKRNNFIANLALSLEGNSLILFSFVEKHGKILYDLVNNKIAKNRKLFFVFGGTDADTRESIRAITEKESNAIIIASYGTFSTGINIRNLHNVVFASPSKSRVRNLQSIGRGLRKGDSKSQCTLYDIADDLQYKKSVNHTLRHLYERVKIYNEEQFDYKMYKIKLEN